jgi:serine/threonine-protein phosphatase 6 regulatory subunit 3
MKQLVEKLSAQSDTRAHQPALELLKNVILMSSFTPTPGRREASVLSSNRLSRDLVSSANSALLITNIFPPSESFSSSSSEDSAFGGDNEASVSSFMSTAASVMELIRKNNSDYFEQYLFLRAREHLMAVQENFQKEHEGAEGEPEDVKPVLEAAMDEIMTKCGLVNLSTLISAICDRLHLLQERLKKPYSSVRVHQKHAQS